MFLGFIKIIIILDTHHEIRLKACGIINVLAHGYSERIWYSR